MKETQLSKEKPPIYQRLHDIFGVEWDKGIIIAYYPNIHCFFNINEQKVHHEAVHLIRQKDMGVELWFKQYITDPGFRLNEEILAYNVEIKWIKENIPGRNERRFLINQIYDDISSSIYGHIINRKEAKLCLQ